MQRGMGGRGVGTGQKVRERHQIRTFSALASHYTGGALCWLLRTSTNARMLISSPVEGFFSKCFLVLYVSCTFCLHCLIILLYLLTCLKSALIIIVGVSTKNTLLLIVDVIVL